MQRKYKMATRKIRLTMSGTQVDGQGPIIDVDFNGVNLDADIDVSAVHGESTITKEYTVDVDAGTYNLDIEYKNDVGNAGDRNFYIDTIEVAHDGTNYEPWFVKADNTNLVFDVNFSYNQYVFQMDDDNNYILNPDYDSTATRTDGDDWWETGRYTSPGNNPKKLYEAKTGPITIFENQVATFNITFS